MRWAKGWSGPGAGCRCGAMLLASCLVAVNLGPESRSRASLFGGCGQVARATDDEEQDRRSADPLKNLSDQSPVRKLFSSFRDSSYRASVSFPKLGRDDLPDLLKMSDSQRRLKTFPTNPISSQLQSEASEGLVALWLVEGIRRGGRFPSLNPQCLDSSDGPVSRVGPSSLERQRHAAKRYRGWWEKVKTRPESEWRQIDPLDGSALHWY